MTTTHAPFFFTEPELISASEAVLQGDDARHLATVRRARAGDIIRIGDGEGLVLEARLVSVGASEVTAEVEREERFERESPVVTVLQGLAKGSKLEVAVQKLVELGVDEIVIFVSGRSVPRHDERSAQKALNRWRSVAREAAKQSRRPWLPSVRGPLDLASAASVMEQSELRLVADPDSSRSLRSALPAGEVRSAALVVGPEGGLAAHEIEKFVRKGAISVQLGPRILRTETASLALAAAVMFHGGRLG